MRDFAERHPGVRLQLMPLPQLTPLARREVDVVIGLDKPEAYTQAEGSCMGKK